MWKFLVIHCVPTYSTTWVLFKLKMHQNPFIGEGSNDPAKGAYKVPSDFEMADEATSSIPYPTIVIHGTTWVLFKLKMQQDLFSVGAPP